MCFKKKRFLLLPCSLAQKKKMEVEAFEWNNEKYALVSEGLADLLAQYEAEDVSKKRVREESLPSRQQQPGEWPLDLYMDSFGTWSWTPIDPNLDLPARSNQIPADEKLASNVSKHIQTFWSLAPSIEHLSAIKRSSPQVWFVHKKENHRELVTKDKMAFLDVATGLALSRPLIQYAQKGVTPMVLSLPVPGREGVTRWAEDLLHFRVAILSLARDRSSVHHRRWSPDMNTDVLNPVVRQQVLNQATSPVALIIIQTFQKSLDEDVTEQNILPQLLAKAEMASQVIDRGGVVAIQLLDMRNMRTVSLLSTLMLCFNGHDFLHRPLGCAPFGPERWIVLTDAKSKDNPGRVAARKLLTCGLEQLCQAMRRRLQRWPTEADSTTESDLHTGWTLCCKSQKFADFCATATNAILRQQDDALRRLLFEMKNKSPKRRRRRSGAAPIAVAAVMSPEMDNWVKGKWSQLAHAQHLYETEITALKIGSLLASISALTAESDGLQVNNDRKSLPQDYFAIRVPKHSVCYTYSSRASSEGKLLYARIRKQNESEWIADNRSIRPAFSSRTRDEQSLLHWLRMCLPANVWLHLVVSFQTGLVLLLDVLRLPGDANLHEQNWHVRMTQAKILFSGLALRSESSTWILELPSVLTSNLATAIAFSHQPGHLLVGQMQRDLEQERLACSEQTSVEGFQKFTVCQTLTLLSGVCTGNCCATFS